MVDIRMSEPPTNQQPPGADGSADESAKSKRESIRTSYRGDHKLAGQDGEVGEETCDHGMLMAAWVSGSEHYRPPD
jgi:hypothetical protein